MPAIARNPKPMISQNQIPKMDPDIVSPHLCLCTIYHILIYLALIIVSALMLHCDESISFSMTERSFCSDELSLSRRSSIFTEVDTRLAPDRNGASCSAAIAFHTSSNGPSIIVLIDVSV